MKDTREYCLSILKNIEEQITEIDDYDTIPVSTHCIVGEKKQKTPVSIAGR